MILKKMRYNICIDYKCLEDPYKNDSEMEVQFVEMVNMAKAGNEFYSLKEARDLV
jgi:hypothetical protein